MNSTILLAVIAISIAASFSLANDASAQSTGTLADIVKKAVTNSTTYGQLPPVSPGTSTILMTFKSVVDGVDNSTFLVDGMPTTEVKCRNEVWTLTIAKAIRPDATPTISIRSGQSFTSGGQSGCEFPPGTSTGLTATAGSPNTSAVSLNWTAPADAGSEPITDYIVQYKKTSETNWSNYTRTTVDRTTTSETVAGLESNTGYDFRVAAISRVDIAPYTPLVPKITYPAAPTGLSKSASGSPFFNYTAVKLGWTAPTGDQTLNYAIHYRLNGTSNAWTTFNDGSSALAGENVTGLNPNTAYQFQVAAANSAGASANSTATAGTTEPAVAPNPPTNLVAGSNNSTSIILTWDKPLINGGANVTKYFVEYKNSTTTWANAEPKISATGTSKIVTGLTEGTTYDFRVAAMNSINNSTYFAGDPASTGHECDGDTRPKDCYAQGSAIPSKRPGLVTGLDFVGLSDQGSNESRPSFTWNAAPPGNSPVTQYFVGVKVLGPGETTWHTNCWNQNTNLYCSQNNVITNQEYYFNVRAKNNESGGSPVGWGDVRGHTLKLAMTVQAPAQVTSVAASSINATALSLDWKKPLSMGATITDYNIYHRIGDSGAWTLYNDGISTDTDATLVELPYGTQYQIRVAAVNSVGPGFGDNSTNTVTYTTGLR